MTSRSHDLRRELRRSLRTGRRVIGTFLKLAVPDAVELAKSAGFDFVVVDLEHSSLSDGEAIALVRHADACGIAALVRLPTVDSALINKLLENGAAGIQLSMVQTSRQVQCLRAATRFAPDGSRSVSLTNRVAGAGGLALADFLHRERSDPPLLVGQVETAVTEPLTEMLPGLDVCFIGPTDLAVDLGVSVDDPRLAEACTALGVASRALAVSFGGWSPSVAAAPGLGLGAAGYLVIGSDLQILANGLRHAALEGTA